MRDLLSDDREALRLANGGIEAFREQTATRILAEHGDEVILNQCPRCGAPESSERMTYCPIASMTQSRRFSVEITAT